MHSRLTYVAVAALLLPCSVVYSDDPELPDPDPPAQDTVTYNVHGVVEVQNPSDQQKSGEPKVLFRERIKNICSQYDGCTSSISIIGPPSGATVPKCFTFNFKFTTTDNLEELCALLDRPYGLGKVLEEIPKKDVFRFGVNFGCKNINNLKNCTLPPPPPSPPSPPSPPPPSPPSPPPSPPPPSPPPPSPPPPSPPPPSPPPPSPPSPPSSPPSSPSLPSSLQSKVSTPDQASQLSPAQTADSNAPVHIFSVLAIMLCISALCYLVYSLAANGRLSFPSFFSNLGDSSDDSEGKPEGEKGDLGDKLRPTGREKKKKGYYKTATKEDDTKKSPRKLHAKRLSESSSSQLPQSTTGLHDIESPEDTWDEGDWEGDW